MATKRKDRKGRILQRGETQRADARYMFQYTGLDGKRHSVYDDTLSGLRQQEKKIRRDLEDGIGTMDAQMTLNEAFEKYISLKRIRNSSELTYRKTWRNMISETLGQRKVATLRKSDIVRFMTDLSRRGLKYSTMHQCAILIQPTLQMLVDDDVLRKNVARGCLDGFTNDKEQKHALTAAQQERLLRFMKNHKAYSVYYPMVLFLLETGLRCGEMLGLTWKDVSFTDNTVDINHQLIYKRKDGAYRLYAETPKTDAGRRVIPLTSTARKALLMQREQQFSSGRRSNADIDGYTDFVFTTLNKQPFIPSGINAMLYRVVDAYNEEATPDKQIPHVSAHILRHTFCTRMAESGMDPKVLQYAMGHSTIEMTMGVYNHTSAERNKAEFEKLERRRAMG